MELKFNADRPKVSDHEINQHKDFEKLVKQFKERSLKQAQGDESWWKNKKVRYSTMIAGVTVICTVSYFTLFKKQQQPQAKHETLITSNNNKKTAAPFVNPPSQKLKIPYATYKVNNAKGAHLKHNHSRIKIPKNTFSDKEGKDIVGDVTIEYREFHDIGDIITSGIPMAYDSAGTHRHLESAGMFDIIGSQDGKPVFIKPDKKIAVEFASLNDEDRFNQYALDTSAADWQYIQRDHAMPVKTTHQVRGIVPQETPNKPSARLLSLKSQVEVQLPKKIDSVKTIYIKRIEQLPRAKEPLKPNQPTKGRPTFKLDGSYSEFPELAAFDNVIFEVGPENSNYTKDLHEVTWSDVKVTQGPVKGKNYVLNLSYRNRAEKLVVYPVLTGADFDKAIISYEEKFSNYETLVEKRKAAEQKLIDEMQAKQAAYLIDLKKKQEAYALEKEKLVASFRTQDQNDLDNSFKNLSNSVRATRLFSVSHFGIFNSDCPHYFPASKSVSPIFVLEGQDNFVRPEYVYLVDHQTRSVFSINAQEALKINYNPESPYSVCVFRGNKIYLCGKENFKKAVDNGSNKFMVKMLPEESENLIDFKKALEI